MTISKREKISDDRNNYKFNDINIYNLINKNGWNRNSKGNSVWGINSDVDNMMDKESNKI